MSDKKVLLSEKLTPLDVEHYAALSSLGVDKNTADAAHLKVIKHSEAMRLCGFTARDIEVSTSEVGLQVFGNFEGIHIPYLSPANGEVYGWSIRRAKPIHERTRDGLLEKRLLRSHHGMYFVPGTSLEHLKNPAVPVVLAAGELTALAWVRVCRVLKSTMIPIGLQNHLSYRSRPQGCYRAKPVPEFEEIVWDGRSVFVALPADSNCTIAFLIDLVEELTNRGAKVEDSLLQVNPAFYWDPRVRPRLPNDEFHFNALCPEIITSPWI